MMCSYWNATKEAEKSKKDCVVCDKKQFTNVVGQEESCCTTPPSLLFSRCTGELWDSIGDRSFSAVYEMVPYQTKRGGP